MMDEWMEENWPDDLNPTPIELLFKDVDDEHARTIPGGSEERRLLDQVPDSLRIGKASECGGWATAVRLRRRDLRAVYEFLYGPLDAEPDSAQGSLRHIRCQRVENLPGLDGNEEDVVEIIGYWD